MTNKARKITLSKFVQTEVVQPSHFEATEITLSMQTKYHVAHVTQNSFEYNPTYGTQETKSPVQFNLYPIVVDSYGAPWAEANIYILDRIKNSLNVVMATFSNIASDLVAFRQFLDDTNVNWIAFDKNKLYRPTYRYRAYLRTMIEAQKISFSSARRRMSTVIAFYRWLKQEGLIKPEFPMWKESDRFIDLKNDYGSTSTKKIKSTDVVIPPFLIELMSRRTEALIIV